MPSPRVSARLAAGVAAVAVVGAGAVAVVIPAQAAEPGVVINEVESDGDDVDWIELANTSSAPVDISGWVVKDNDDARTDAIPAGTLIAPGGYYVFAQPEMSFGLGKQDAARLFHADGATLVDSYEWTKHAAVTYGRCADGVGGFADTATPTPGAANDCGAPTPQSTATPTPTPTPTTEPTAPAMPLPAAGALVVNEIESNGDDTDWFELFNTTASGIDISGFIVRDNSEKNPYALPAGTVVPARGILLVDQATSHSPGFDFGLGGADQVRLFAPDGVNLVTQASWETHSKTSYGLCPDGVGELRETTVTTKGAPNNCALPVVINEVESSDGAPGDWIELANTSGDEIAVGGLVVTDSDIAGHRYAIPAGTVIAGNGYLVLEEADFGFGLGKSDEVHLFDADGTTELDATAWTAHATTTWGRCPDVAGEFGATSEPTKGIVNRCAGQIVVDAWPGAPSTRVLDAEGDFAGDLSGLDYADGGLWAVENGNGILYRLVEQGESWSAAPGWDGGVTLRYADGTGTVDAEGVTAVGDAVYVSSERNNANGKISRPSVLRYAPAPGADLSANAEWNLAADLPGLGANAGLEGITWIPDAWLVGHGFVDENTGAAYNPAQYAGHGDGLFFVGVEGTASVYAYALNADGTFARIAAIATPFALVADVQFDRDLLWVACDEACDGRTATYEIDEAGAFAATHIYARPSEMANYANEGFAIGSACVDGFAATFYADDADTDGFSLRSGTLPCTTGTTPVEPTPNPTPTPTPTVTPNPTPTPEPTVTPAPTAPSAGAPDAASLTDANRGGLTASGPVIAGGSLTLTVPGGAAGQQVHVWLFSTPTDLGAATLTTARTATVTVPASTAAGAHRVVVTDASGAILGWTELTVTRPAGLAATGGDAHTQGVLAIGSALLLAAGFALTRRARRTEG